MVEEIPGFATNPVDPVRAKVFVEAIERAKSTIADAKEGDHKQLAVVAMTVHKLGVVL